MVLPFWPIFNDFFVHLPHPKKQFEGLNGMKQFLKDNSCFHASAFSPDVFVRYRKVTSSNTSRFEAHAGIFKLLMKGILYPYVVTF